MVRWTNDLIFVAIQITVWIQGLFSGFVTIGRYEKWYQQTAAWLCSAGHALAGIVIATTTLLHHRPITDSHDRRALVEVCTVPVLLVMAALWNRADHYIFILSFVLPFFFLLFSSSNLSLHRLDVCMTHFHTWCGLNANLGCRSEICCTQLAKKLPSGHHRTTLSGYIFASAACIDNRKKLVKQQ